VVRVSSEQGYFESRLGRLAMIGSRRPQGYDQCRERGMKQLVGVRSTLKAVKARAVAGPSFHHYRYNANLPLNTMLMKLERKSSLSHLIEVGTRNFLFVSSKDMCTPQIRERS
jgi:hypothetical protein